MKLDSPPESLAKCMATELQPLVVRLYLSSAAANEGLANNVLIVVGTWGHAPMLLLPDTTPLVAVLQQLLWFSKAFVRGPVHMSLGQQLVQAVWVGEMDCVPIC